MKVQKLKSIDENPTLFWGLNGYITEHIFQPELTSGPGSFSFEFKKIRRRYQKTWITTDQDIAEFNQIIGQGCSYGIFDQEKLIAWIIIDQREWNNSLYIENLLVNENYRGKGLGKKLLDCAKAEMIRRKARLLELETQNTNAPAIGFYQSQGFTITGFNLKLYDGLKDEFAIYMTYERLFA